tara:strand:- start:419 stop:775 length:357 start_codon:yes stop_codon:yes gene_type:complete
VERLAFVAAMKIRRVSREWFADNNTPLFFCSWGKSMSVVKRPNIKKLQAACDRFNSQVAVGDSVLVKLDGVDEPFQTKTRSAAQVLSGHSAVIWLENVSGCYLLDRVTKTPDGPVKPN